MLLEPGDETLESYVTLYQNNLASALFNGQPVRQNISKWHQVEADWQRTYAALCRGEKLMVIIKTINKICFSISSQRIFLSVFDLDPTYFQLRDLEDSLVCRYRRTTIPYYTVKEEIMSYNPRIVLLYEVIHDKEIDYFLDAASTEVQSSVLDIPFR